MTFISESLHSFNIPAPNRHPSNPVQNHIEMVSNTVRILRDAASISAAILCLEHPFVLQMDSRTCLTCGRYFFRQLAFSSDSPELCKLGFVAFVCYAHFIQLYCIQNFGETVAFCSCPVFSPERLHCTIGFLTDALEPVILRQLR